MNYCDYKGNDLTLRDFLGQQDTLCLFEACRDRYTLHEFWDYIDTYYDNILSYDEDWEVMKTLEEIFSGELEMMKDFTFTYYGLGLLTMNEIMEVHEGDYEEEEIDAILNEWEVRLLIRVEDTLRHKLEKLRRA